MSFELAQKLKSPEPPARAKSGSIEAPCNCPLTEAQASQGTGANACGCDVELSGAEETMWENMRSGLQDEAVPDSLKGKGCVQTFPIRIEEVISKPNSELQEEQEITGNKAPELFPRGNAGTLQLECIRARGRSIVDWRIDTSEARRNPGYTIHKQEIYITTDRGGKRVLRGDISPGSNLIGGVVSFSHLTTGNRACIWGSLAGLPVGNVWPFTIRAVVSRACVPCDGV